MTESDAVAVATPYTSKPKPDAEHQSDMAALAAQQLDGILLRTFPGKGAKVVKVTRHPGGRRPTMPMRTLRQALAVAGCNMPNGGTLEEWCVEIRGGPKFRTPAAPGHPSREIEYADALTRSVWREKIRKCFLKILRNKLLPGC